MITIDADKCTNCAVCSYVCPHGAIKMNGNGVIEIDNDKCIDCAACQLNCPVEAILTSKQTGCLTVIIKKDILKKKSCDCCC